MNAIVQVIEARDDRIVRCKVRYLCDVLVEAKEKYDILSKDIPGLILVADFTQEKLWTLSVSQLIKAE